MDEERRVALVTGSGKGVGAGVVKVLCSRGVRCCINCNSNVKMAEETLRLVEEAGGEAILVKADVTDPAELDAMISRIVEKWGRLDILVNNAAMQPNMFVDEYDVKTMQWLWNVNIGGYFHTTKKCLPYLKQSPMPRIVNISSIHGKRPTNFDVGYAMTKAAIRMFTRELALELAPDGIPVNTIDLGACRIQFKTGSTHNPFYQPPDVRNPDMRGRFRMSVEPEDVGNLIWFLCSREAEPINGDGIRLDRGYVLI